MEEKDSKQISKKNILEKVKLHPTTLELNESCSQIALSEKKTHIPKKQSKYKGVSWSLSHRKWTVVATIGRKTFSLGRYATDQAAALAYDEFARKLIKRFTKNLNFPDNTDMCEAMDERAVEEAAEESPDDADFFGPSTVSDYESALESGNVGDGEEV